jgi:hypothetical protein
MSQNCKIKTLKFEHVIICEAISNKCVFHKLKNYVKLDIHGDQEQTVKNLCELELEIHHFRSTWGISSVKGVG